MINISQLTIMAAACWHNFVGGFSVWCGQWPAMLASKLFGHRAACLVDRITQMAVLILLFQWLAWWIAEDYLRDKWEAERLEANRRWYEENRRFYTDRGGRHE